MRYGFSALHDLSLDLILASTLSLSHGLHEFKWANYRDLQCQTLQKGHRSKCFGLDPLMADAALAAENWRLAAELFSEDVARCRQQLTEGHPDLPAFCRCLAGRSRALAEMGRPRARLEAQREVLQAALADGRAAAAGRHRVGERR